MAIRKQGKKKKEQKSNRKRNQIITSKLKGTRNMLRGKVKHRILLQTRRNNPKSNQQQQLITKNPTQHNLTLKSLPRLLMPIRKLQVQAQAEFQSVLIRKEAPRSRLKQNNNKERKNNNPNTKINQNKRNNKMVKPTLNTSKPLSQKTIKANKRKVKSNLALTISLHTASQPVITKIKRISQQQE